MTDETGTFEGVKEVEKGDDGVVKRWMLEIDKAGKTEKHWRKDAKEANSIYRLEEYDNEDFAKKKETFNILWSNTETIRPVLYNSTPRPDVRRRYKDKDPLGKAVSEVCERAVTYTLDSQDIDVPLVAAVNDMLIPGRAITRVRYNPSFTPIETEGELPEGEEPAEELAYEEVTYEQVQWDDFRRGPGKNWSMVPWIAFRHKLNKDQVRKQFSGFEDSVQYDVTAYDDDEKDTNVDKDIFKRCVVWEVWDKEARRVVFIAPSYKDKALYEESDPLELKDFWPIPRPLYAIESSTSLVPSTKYSMYEILAKELENVTNRIRKILNGLRLRGIYDSTIPELEKLFDAFDNAFVPAENVARLIELGGLEKAIWTLPLEMYTDVLMRLYEYRQGLIQQIYEITGISDVIRGSTDPNETLGAQKIKANFGSQRLQREQREVQRYARDLVRMTVEIISEHFSADTLRLMTGLNFPTQEMKQQAQQQIVMQQQAAQAQHQQTSLQAQQSGQPVPEFAPPEQDPNVAEMMQTPTWEEIQEVMSNDMMRDYRIDIETDSTIQAEQQEDQKSITDLLTGITNFMAGIAEPIASGVLTIDAAKSMLLSAVRRFKLGREVEDALEDIEAPQGQQGVPQEEVQAQMEQVQQQAEQQVKEAQTQAEKMAKQSESEAMSKAQEYSAKCDEEVKQIQDKVQMDLEAEKARNKIKEETDALNYAKQVFALEQRLVGVENNYQDEMRNKDEEVRSVKSESDGVKSESRDNDVNQGVEIYKAVQETKDKKEAEAKKAEDAKPKKPQEMQISGFDKFMSSLGAMFAKNDEKLTKALDTIAKAIPESKDHEKEERVKQETLGMVMKELNKPRTVKRNDEGEIVGIE